MKDFIPPILLKLIKRLSIKFNKSDSSQQNLKMYWNKEYADKLDKWGETNTWIEIQMFMFGLKGKVLDIACGSGPTIKILEKNKNLDLFGFDISDLLIERAISKGIPSEKMKVMDATKTDYLNNEFDYSFSIGSLEHFTEQGIIDFLKEAARYTEKVSFHMIPLSKENKDEGWLTTHQSFFNNSINWWMEKFQGSFTEVTYLRSRWEDELSNGYWFICKK